jgi:hypothetical protein
LIYTTEKPEKTAVEYYSKFYGSYRAGIDNFVKDMKRSGLKLPQFFNKVNSMRKPIYEEGKAEILQLVS